MYLNHDRGTRESDCEADGQALQRDLNTRWNPKTLVDFLSVLDVVKETEDL